MKKTTLLLFAAFLLGGSAPHPPSSTLLLRPNRDYALFFAVNDYDHWDDLANPISDVEAIAKDLQDLYGFETEIVRNPDRKTILDKIEEYRQKTYAQDAQLLIFFSGHGEFNEATKQGYFVPKNGQKNDTYGDSYIEYEGLKRRISSLPCEHILLALDACYSGTADESIAMRGEPGKRPGANADAERERYISTSLQYRSRIMLTSGGKVRTPDKSQFVARFLEALRSQGGDDRLINTPELLGYLTTAAPRPVSCTFGDHAPGGEFLFSRSLADPGSGKEAPAGEVEPETEYDIRQDVKAWKSTQAAHTVEAYQRYLVRFPKGEFRQLAQAEMNGLSSGQDAQQDDLEWKEALKANSLDAFRKYQSDYPEGRHFKEAKSRLENPGNAKDGMVFIKGGRFLLGNDQGAEDEKPAQTVQVSDFYLAATEVTNAQFCAFLNDRDNLAEGGADWLNLSGNWQEVKCRIKKTGVRFEVEKGFENYPVVYVSWFGARAYCQWLTDKSGGKQQYRLPAEAEWEYAAGNGSAHTAYSWGNDPPIGKKGGNVADQSGEQSQARIFPGYSDGFSTVAPVASFAPSALRIYDLTGNVAEWCSDWYAPYPYLPQPPDMKSPKGSKRRVYRGGAWRDDPVESLITTRNSQSPDFRNECVGFRPARSVK